MARETPTTADLLFRQGQPHFGTYEGKAAEMRRDSLSEQKRQTDFLREMTQLQRERTALVPYQAPPITQHVEVLPPEVDISGLADELRPEFEDLAETQKELGEKVSALGYLGQMALQESRGQTGLLESLNEQGQEAYSQRNEALQRMSEAIVQHRAANRKLGSIDRGIIGVRRDIGLSTAILGDHIDDLNDALTGALGDLGSDIHTLTDEIIETRLAVVQAIEDSQSIFLWSHREQMWVRQQTLDVLSNPRRTAAREAWEIGEQCRRTGNRQEAIRMYRESLRTNPAEARNHVSMGLMGLEIGDPRTAKNYFAAGARFDLDPKVKGTSLMHLAKIEMFDKNFPQAKTLLELALDADVTNLEIWFDLAICEMKLGNRQRALYYIRNLLWVPLRVSKKQAPEAAQYALKIVAETAFTPLMPQIRQIMFNITQETSF